MLRYIHVQAEPIIRNYSRLMISHGNYNLLPHNAVLVYQSSPEFCFSPIQSLLYPPPPVAYII